MEIATLGIDLAKSVFQLHGIDAADQIVLKKRLRRNQVLEFLSRLPRCLVGIEACGRRIGARVGRRRSRNLRRRSSRGRRV